MPVNIFVLDRDPVRAARLHCDRHVVKMVLETAQILSTAMWQLDGASAAAMRRRGLAYRPTHANHPCVVWAAGSAGNFRWLVRLGLALADEYSFRYGGRRHRSSEVIAVAEAWLDGHANSAVHTWPRRRTPFVQAMPEEYRRADAAKAYRAYYAGEKAAICTWTGRRTPRWMSPG